MKRGDKPDFTDDEMAAMEAAIDGGTGEPPVLTQDQIDAMGAGLVRQMMKDWKKHQQEIGTHAGDG